MSKRIQRYWWTEKAGTRYTIYEDETGAIVAMNIEAHNARLIAATPQTVEALEGVDEWLRTDATIDNCPDCDTGWVETDEFEGYEHYESCIFYVVEAALEAARGSHE